MTSSDTLSSAAQMFAVADRLFGAVEAHDLETVRSCYAPDVRVWHNADNAVQTLDENIQTLTYVITAWSNFRYEDVRRRVIDGGFIQQHNICGEGPDGTPFSAPAVVVVTVGDDGKITAVDEYFDASQLPALG